MNLPNKLTILRVIMIPFFVLALYMTAAKTRSCGMWPQRSFIIASLTDMLDGKIARKYNLVTNFGKFITPLADKLLVCSAFDLPGGAKELPAWMVIVIISRGIHHQRLPSGGLRQRGWSLPPATGESLRPPSR